MPDDNTNRHPLSRGAAYAFVFGGALASAAVADLVRALFHLNSSISNSALLMIVFTGMAIGGIAGIIFMRFKARTRPNHRTDRGG